MLTSPCSKNKKAEHFPAKNKSAIAYKGLSYLRLWIGTGNIFKVIDAAEATSLLCTANEVNQTLPSI